MSRAVQLRLMLPSVRGHAQGCSWDAGGSVPSRRPHPARHAGGATEVTRRCDSGEPTQGWTRGGPSISRRRSAASAPAARSRRPGGRMDPGVTGCAGSTFPTPAPGQAAGRGRHGWARMTGQVWPRPGGRVGHRQGHSVSRHAPLSGWEEQDLRPMQVFRIRARPVLLCPRDSGQHLVCPGSGAPPRRIPSGRNASDPPLSGSSRLLRRI